MDDPIPRPVKITRIAIDPVTQTEIKAPINCNNVSLSTDDPINGFYYYTTANDDDTRILILPFGFFEVRQGVFHPGTGFRFPIGATIGWVKSVAGVGPLVLTVVR